MLKPLQDKLASVESIIAKLEEEKAALIAKMNDPGFAADATDMRIATARFAVVEHELEKTFSSWTKASEEVEQALSKLGADE